MAKAYNKSHKTRRLKPTAKNIQNLKNSLPLALANGIMEKHIGFSPIINPTTAPNDGNQSQNKL